MRHNGDIVSRRRSATRSKGGERSAFLVTQGEWKPLPQARFGSSTLYVGFNDRGWLAGYVALEEDTSFGKGRGFIARP